MTCNFKGTDSIPSETDDLELSPQRKNKQKDHTLPNQNDAQGTKSNEFGILNPCSSTKIETDIHEPFYANRSTVVPPPYSTSLYNAAGGLYSMNQQPYDQYNNITPASSSFSCYDKMSYW